MRNFKARFIDGQLIDEQDVEVERSWAILHAGRTVATEFKLDGQQTIQQHSWLELGHERDNRIDEMWLVGKSHRSR